MINTFISVFNNSSRLQKINVSSMRVTSKKAETLKYNIGNVTKNFTIDIGDRISIQDTATSNKYIEEIRWNSRGNNMAIAIGLNPSKCLPHSLDNTNKKVCCVLHHQGYDGYYLINLYSHMQAKGFTGIGYNDLTDVIKKTIFQYVSKNKLKHINVIFFFGCTFGLSKL